MPVPRPAAPCRLREGASHGEARAYLVAHDTRVTRIDRMGDSQLRWLWTQDMKLAGLESLLGGPEGHDELVNYIADMEYPDASCARDIYHTWVLSGKQPAVGQE